MERLKAAWWSGHNTSMLAGMRGAVVSRAQGFDVMNFGVSACIATDTLKSRPEAAPVEAIYGVTLTVPVPRAGKGWSPLLIIARAATTVSSGVGRVLRGAGLG